MNNSILITLCLQGDLVIGKSGIVVGDISEMGILITEGKIVGTVQVERCELRGKVRGYESWEASVIKP